jgi:LmbE family N-acetylglucosaminyl deacetylase
MKEVNRILVLAPHPDDGEFGAGGSLKRWTEEGKDVHYVAFSPCLKSLPEGSEPDRLYHELLNATGILGLNPDNVRVLDFPVREFPANRQLILDTLLGLKKEINPDLVLMPNSHDVHQDHQVIHREGIRAFKHASLIGYELPWNNLTVINNFHVTLDRNHIDAKMRALHEYSSQKGRPYMNDEFFFGLAKTRGIQVNTDYAEAFELIRYVV